MTKKQKYFTFSYLSINCWASRQTTDMTVISSSNLRNLAYISMRERSLVKAVSLLSVE